MNLLSKIRSELGQLSYSFKRRNTPKLWRDQVEAIRFLKVHNLPAPHLKGPRQEVWAVSVVKNELDILPSVLDHFFAQGIDRIIVADNLSTDGTREYLRQRANEDSRLIFAEDNCDRHIQSEKITYLSHLAWRSGARWIIPFDGDEFWYAEDEKLGDFLRNAPDNMGIYYAGFHHTVPTVDSPENIVDAELVMDASYPFPGKCAFRSHPFAVVSPGNPEGGRLGDIERRLEMVHRQYRGIAQIARKVRVGTETSRRTGEDLSYFAPHWEAGSKLSDAEIAEVWENISHGRPDERIKFVAEGPIVHGKFLKWNYWNEDGSIPKGDA